MEPAGLSTAIMLALAAVLWFLYFIPGWMRRREYLATQRTAIRLQRTVRVMAETAELPEEVRFEASAREAAKAERLRLAAERDEARRALREAHAAAAARAEAEAVRRREAAVRIADAGPGTGARLRQRLRRTRRAAGLLLLAALVIAAAQFALMATTGVAAGAWGVLAGCALAAATSIAVQRRIGERMLRAASAVPADARPAPVESLRRQAAPRRDWTPVPVPRPRYLEHPDAAPLGPSLAAPTMDAAAWLRVAAAEARRQEPGLVPLPARSTPPGAPGETPGAPSRYASMGMVGELGSSLDLDEVLRRRRVG